MWISCENFLHIEHNAIFNSMTIIMESILYVYHMQYYKVYCILYTIIKCKYCKDKVYCTTVYFYTVFILYFAHIYRKSPSTT